MSKRIEAVKRFITGGILGSIFWFVFFYMHTISFSILLGLIILIILFNEWDKLFNLNRFWFWFIMPWYPILPFCLMIYLNHQPAYRHLLYYMFLIVFSFDGMSYIVGALLGRYKIVPTISPGKTVEGCIGGLFATYVSFAFALYTSNIVMPWYKQISLVTIACLLAFLGDIFESFLKRQAHLKDSGNLLPGHGGFLDRFDAVMMVSYFAFLFKDELIKLL